VPRKARFSDLPFDVNDAREPDVKKLLDNVIKAAQQNFDSLSGDQKGIVAEFNRLAQDVATIAEFLGADTDTEGQTIEVTGAGLGSHDELEDVSANDHHNQSHTQADHDVAEAGDLSSIDIGDAAAAGSSVEVPNADHQHALPAPTTGYPVDVAATEADGVATTVARSDHGHAHGTGYAGAHSDAVNDGDTAGGVLSGTYPNPGFASDMATQAELDAHTHPGSGSGTPGFPGMDGEDGDSFFIPGPPGAAGATGPPGSDGAGGSGGGAPGMPGEDGDDFGMWVPPATGGGGVSAHSSLTGLTSGDDHTQYVLEATADVTGTLQLSGDVNDSQSTQQDDYAPAGLSTATRLRFNALASLVPITGITAGSDGRVVIINEVGGIYGFKLKHDVTSTAANRFYCPEGVDVTIPPYGSAVLVYSASASRWVVAANSPLAASTQTRTEYLYITPDTAAVDDATLGSTGATPDIVGQLVFAEAVPRAGAYFTYGVPGDWKSGTPIYYDIIWYSNTSTGNMAWTLSAYELASGATPSTASTSDTATTIDEVITTVADSTTVKVSTLLTKTAGSLDNTFIPTAAGNIVKVNIERQGGHANDTATGAGRILSLRLRYTAEGISGPTGATGATGAAATTAGSYQWTSTQGVTSATTSRRLYTDRAGTITGVRLYANTNTAASILVDVLKNGVSLGWTGAGAAPSLSAAYLGTERVPDTVSFAKGDYFVIDVGSGTYEDRLNAIIAFTY
jgi:hypothetical protein